MARDGARLLAVLIDADNVSSSAAEPILREIAGLGEPGLRRVYGDWSSPSLGGWKKVAMELGLVMHQQSANTKGKNASDIGLVIDAMDILHGGKFDGFVLVSSDSDFTRLASRIREDGLEVIGIGEEKTPAALRNVCNRFIFIENILRGSEAVAAPKATAAASGGTRPAAKKADNAGAATQLDAFNRLVRKAMNAIDPDGEWYSLGQVGQFIQREAPDFDPRTYGSAKLSDLLRKTGAFDVRQGTGNHLEVQRRD